MLNATPIACRDTQALLSDYLENALSARRTWSVEKHLADCPDCAEALAALRGVIALVQDAPRFDTSDIFMARLHARLDDAAPVPQTASGRIREMLRGLQQTLAVRPAPVFGVAGVALVLLVGLTVSNRTPVGVKHGLPAAPQEVFAPALRQDVRSSVAVTASDPFQDPAAANLEAHSLLQENTGSANDDGSSTSL